jgi:hypothetical protein
MSDEPASDGPKVGMNVVLRKPHACGAAEWEITRVGADIGLRCLGCGRRIMIEREQFRRQLKRMSGEGRDD